MPGFSALTQSQVVLADAQAAMAGSTTALSALSASGGPAKGMGRLAAWVPGIAEISFMPS